MARLLPNKTRGVPRVDDRRVISGIIHVLKSGAMSPDAPSSYGARKTLYNRFVRWAAKASGPICSRRWQRPAGRLQAAAGQLGSEGTPLCGRRQRECRQVYRFRPDRCQIGVCVSEL